MPKRINVADFNDGDNTTIIYKDPYVLAGVDRNGVGALSANAPETNSPGVYILIGDDHRVYVGQSHVSLAKRLVSHSKNSEKDWFDHVIMFFKRGGVLDGAQLDFIERTLIFVLKQSGYDLDNRVDGNTSDHLEGFRLSEAQKAMYEFAAMLDKFKSSFNHFTPNLIKALDGERNLDTTELIPAVKQRAENPEDDNSSHLAETEISDDTLVIPVVRDEHTKTHSHPATDQGFVPKWGEVDNGSYVDKQFAEAHKNDDLIISLIEKYVSGAWARSQYRSFDVEVKDIFNAVQAGLPFALNKEHFDWILNKIAQDNDSPIICDNVGNLWSAIPDKKYVVPAYNILATNYSQTGIVALNMNIFDGIDKKSFLLTSQSLDGMQGMINNNVRFRDKEFYISDLNGQPCQKVPSIVALMKYARCLGDIQVEEENAGVFKRAKGGIKRFFDTDNFS